MTSNKAGLTHSRARLGEIITSTKPLAHVDVSDAELFDRALYEGVNALLWQSLLSSDVDVDEGFADALQEQLEELKAKYLRLRHVTGRILTSLAQQEIAAVCMRGVVVAEGLYGDMAAFRPISDIDLLVEEKQMLDVKQTLWDIGFRPNPKYRNIYYRGDISVDLHHEPLGIERIEMWKHLTPLRIEDFMKYAEEGELAGEKALLLPPRINLPYLCFHALKHSFERLIWLYDIALLADQVSRDGAWGEVLAGVREYGLQRPCYYALSYVEAHLGAEVPEEVLSGIKPDMGFVERSLFRRHMSHEIIPFLAERLFARMQPDFAHRVRFWRETIYPRYEVRAQMVEEGCVKCNFIRKRIKQLAKASWLFIKEGVSLVR